MHRLVRIIAALSILAATLIAAGVQAAPSQAGTAQTYLVLYKGNAVAADAITASLGNARAELTAWEPVTRSTDLDQ